MGLEWLSICNMTSFLTLLVPPPQPCAHRWHEESITDQKRMSRYSHHPIYLTNCNCVHIIYPPAFPLDKLPLFHVSPCLLVLCPGTRNTYPLVQNIIATIFWFLSYHCFSVYFTFSISIKIQFNFSILNKWLYPLVVTPFLSCLFIKKLSIFPFLKLLSLPSLHYPIATEFLLLPFG